jgi:type IV pilus assembly protein PilY1
MFDVRIFSDDDDHPNGWGTIMVAGMRFGGGSVDADAAGDTRKFMSAYMIFDITNPEAPPVLLGELTYDSATSAHMGYTTMVPVVTPMKETEGETVTTKWYLILGSGPLVLDGSSNWEYNTALEGSSNQAAKVAVIPLDTLASGGAFRIPDSAPDADNAGVIVLEDGSGTAVDGFVSDPISVDFDLSNDYRADAIYFGTVEGDWTGWGGRLFRLVTNADSGISDPGTWELKEMLNPGRPVTAAPMAGWDGQNFWIYFGTGRFFDEDDKSNASSGAQESYYGLKEPVSCSDGVTFEWPTLEISDLLSVGSIRVAESTDMATAALSCDGGGSACLPTGVTTFSELDIHIAGTGCVDDDHTGTGGWAHDFDLSGERNLGQSTLLGGLLTFTTYQPFDDLCKLEGESYLYGLYYRTGTAWHESVFDDGGSDPVEYKKDLGQGLATTPNLHVGKEEGGTAYAQTSTGAIVEIQQPNMPIDAVKTGRMYWRTD